MRNTFLKSLQFRLSLLFVLMLLLVSVVFLFTLTESTEMYLAESLQTTNRNLAKSISKELNIDEQTNDFYEKDLGRVFESAMIINPNIKLYLVHTDGETYGYSSDSGYVQYQVINTAPIKSFLESSNRLPIFGQNPIDTNHSQVFSASIIRTPEGSVHCYLYVMLSSEKNESLLSMIQKSYILSVLFRTVFISFFIAIVFGLLMISLLTRDLRKLISFIRSIQAEDFSARITLNSSSELSELAESFNDMAARIEKSIHQLKLNDDQRRELVANISHDLRTPLASIEGYLETVVLKEHLLTEDEKKTYKQIILKNVRTLSTLISQLFELSKFEAKQIEPVFEPFSISDLLHDVVLQQKTQALQKEIHLNAKLPEESIFVNADISMIQRVLQNLIENAIHYTGQNGTITIELKHQYKIPQKEDHYVLISINDSGSGISEEDLKHIFERYYRSDKVRSKYRSGLGLGLSISKHILELHHSTLQVESKIGEGTVFSFSLQAIHKPYSNQQST